MWPCSSKLTQHAVAACNCTNVQILIACRSTTNTTFNLNQHNSVQSFLSLTQWLNSVQIPERQGLFNLNVAAFWLVPIDMHHSTLWAPPIHCGCLGDGPWSFPWAPDVQRAHVGLTWEVWGWCRVNNMIRRRSSTLMGDRGPLRQRQGNPHSPSRSGLSHMELISFICDMSPADTDKAVAGFVGGPTLFSLKTQCIFKTCCGRMVSIYWGRGLCCKAAWGMLLEFGTHCRGGDWIPSKQKFMFKLLIICVSIV